MPFLSHATATVMAAFRSRRRAPGASYRFLLLAFLAAASSGAAAQTVLYRCTDAAGELTIQTDPCPAGSQERKQVVQDLPSAPPPLPAPAPKATLPEPEWQLPQGGPGPVAPPALTRPSGPADATPSTITALPGPGQPLVREVPLEVITDDAAGADAVEILDSGTPLAEREAVPDEPRGDDTDEPRAPPPPLYTCRTWDNDTYLGERADPPPRCAPLQTVGIGGQPGIAAGMACEMREDSCAPVPGDQLCQGWLRRLRDEQAKLVFARSDDPAATRAEVERIDALIGASNCH